LFSRPWQFLLRWSIWASSSTALHIGRTTISSRNWQEQSNSAVSGTHVYTICSSNSSDYIRCLSPFRFGAYHFQSFLLKACVRATKCKVILRTR
jgi:hypothetical protein